jgi:FkbM family methyltransferase
VSANGEPTRAPTHRTRNVLYFLARYVLFRRYLIARAPAFGLRLRFRIEDAIGRWIYKRGSYEAELTDYIAHHIAFRDGDVFLDVGANIGWYPLVLARTRRIATLAFEPDPLNFALLEENVRLNGCASVRPIRKAVADTEGTRTLYRYANKNLGRHSLLPINDKDTVEVETVTLDGFLAREGIVPERVAFMKVDVEGYELPVLNGAKRLLEAIPLVLCEYSPGYMRRGGMEPKALLGLLREKGFEPYRLEAGALQPLTFAELEAVEGNDVNVFWVKGRQSGR